MKAVPALTAALLIALVQAHAGPLWTPSHVVIVVEENHTFASLYNNPSVPYLNGLAANGALFTQSYNPPGLHPSLPNYLELMSGQSYDISDDAPVTFTSPYPGNLFASLTAAGYSDSCYSEDLPYAGYTGVQSGEYVRKHNPCVPWQGDDSNLQPNQLPSSVNQPFTAFPTDFNALPTVSFVIPNLCDDAHDTCDSNPDGATMDMWLQANISAYASWAVANNSLLIVTTDESDYNDDPIFTMMYGSNVIVGQYSEYINHDNVLRTIEDMYGLTALANSATAAPITDAFASSDSLEATPEPGTLLLLASALGAVLLRRFRSIA